ncbi:MAG: type III polyketide synthase [Actinomycetes bacterium]
MPVRLHAIGTAVPATVLRQPEVRDLLRAQPQLSRRNRRLVEVAFDASDILTRHTVVEELGGAVDLEPVFLDRDSGAVRRPGTGRRNAIYAQTAPGLLVEAASAALADADGFAAGDVTHLVTVSCTGFTAPGPDQVMVERLGLDPSVERFHLGFMGCHGAFPALRAAVAFCTARPDAVVLVACVELCTLHLQPSDDADAILAASLFRDGAAAVVVSARPARAGAAALDLDGLRTELLSAGAAEMSWTIGDSGFAMVLSSYLPRLLAGHLEKAITPLFDADPHLAGRPFAAVPRWAVHPGGRSIVDKVQLALDLDGTQVREARQVLRAYGNMSSVTVLFVLREILAGPAPGDGGERVCALAFGPGLTVESALLTLRTAA